MRKDVVYKVAAGAWAGGCAALGVFFLKKGLAEAKKAK